MALINSSSNVFTAVNLPSRPLSQSSSFARYLPKMLPREINYIFLISNFQKQQKQKQKKQSEESYHFYDRYAHMSVLAKTESKSEEKPILNLATMCMNRNANSKRVINCEKNVQSKSEDLILRLLDSMEAAKSKRAIHDQQIEGIQNNQEYYEKISSEMEEIENEVRALLEQEQKSKYCYNENLMAHFEKAMKFDHALTYIFIMPSMTQIKNCLNFLVHPLTVSFNKFKPKTEAANEKQRQDQWWNEERVVYLNFGKETYLNVRAINQTTQLLYISFYNQYLANNSHPEKDLDGTYGLMIDEEMYSPPSIQESPQSQNKYCNTLLFPLNMIVWQDYSFYPDHRNVQDRPYQQFGASSDIFYLFQNVCVDRIRRYKADRVVITMDGTTILDPVHFAEIIKILTEFCNNKITLVLNEDCFKHANKDDNPFIKERYFCRYMNYDLQHSESQTIIDCVTAFINVMSGTYIPVSNKIVLPSQLFRQYIRYDYIQKHSKIFASTSQDMMRLLPSDDQRELFNFAVTEANKQLKIEVNNNQEEKTIPYKQMILETSINYYQTPIHHHQSYKISRRGVLYDTLHRQRIPKHKFVSKTDKKTSQIQILNEVSKLRFLKKGQKQYHQIKLEEYSQVQILRKEKNIIVIILNYYNLADDGHYILWGVASQKSKTILMNELSNSFTPREYVNVGYQFYSSNQMDHLYLLWPMTINTKQNIKARILGRPYMPQEFSVIKKLTIQDFSKIKIQEFDLREDFKREKGRGWKATIFQMPESDPKNPRFYVMGGYSHSKYNPIRRMQIHMEEGKYTIKSQGAPNSENMNIPVLTDFHVICKKDKNKASIYDIHDGKSPFFVHGSFYSYKIEDNQKNDKDKSDKRLQRIQNDKMNYLKMVAQTSQSGYFNVVDTYPTNTIRKKYFDEVPRLRYTFKFNTGVLTFDEAFNEYEENMLLHLVEGIDTSYPDEGVYVKSQNDRRKYLTFLFHNPFRTDQPFYMMIDPQTFKPHSTNKKNKKKIILKIQGYLVYILIIGGRMNRQMNNDNKKQDFQIEFVGNLFDVMDSEEETIVRMKPYKIEFNIQQSMGGLQI